MSRLIASPKVSEKRKASLRLVYDVCHRRFGLGESDFRISVVAVAVGETGLLSRSTVQSDENNEYRQIAFAWRLRAEERGPVIDGDIPAGHPDAVLQRLQQAPARRNNKRESLETLHDLCRAMFDRGDLDFRAAGVAQAARELGIKNCGKIRNDGETGELINAWKAYALDAAESKPASNFDGQPNEILKRLITAPGRSTRLDVRLQAIYDACEARYRAGELYISHYDIAQDVFEAGVFGSVRSGISQINLRESYKTILTSWQTFIDSTWLSPDEGLPRDHPDAVYRRLTRKITIAHKRATLQKVHRLCQVRSDSGNRDFRPSVMGRLCAEAGLLRAKSFSSPSLKDYRTLFESWSKHVRPWLTQNVPAEIPDRIQRANDASLEWVRRDFPELEHWRQLGVEWLAGKVKGLHHCLSVFSQFYGSYLILPEVPKSPEMFFRRGTVVPDYSEAIKKKGNKSQSHNNTLHDFFDWILVAHLSERTDEGELIVSPAHRNPLRREEGSSDRRKLFESVRSPLPYGYIHELRRMLASGANFRDWQFAQSAQGATIGELGAPGRDWYEVDPSEIDRDDPDCVWRIRIYKDQNGLPGRSAYQMWSPVRWVAVLTKLLVPFRTSQVRWLDSGESDTWRYSQGQWIRNDHLLADEATDGYWQQGVLRRVQNKSDANPASPHLYINTNKTADQDKSGAHKGYVTPWFNAPDRIENVFYWLEKLRNWQSKYNPITRRTAWRELDARHISAKSLSQLAAYSDTCFLFRLAESPHNEERGLPISDGVVSHAWTLLLRGFQTRLADRGETHPGGLPIELVTTDEHGKPLSAYFPLHSLRVSLITALALDGDVPFPILQKLVGHSRLLMTIYYTKLGHSRTAEMLAKAAERLDASKDRSIHQFLLDSEHAKLVETAVCNSPASLAAVIPIYPAERNAAGWMQMHHGLCLVGGNTSEFEGDRAIGGCYNGGPNVGTSAKPTHGPVPGGSRNCVRCRWFVTEPHYVPALTAHFNVVAYHFDEARNESIAAESELQVIRRKKAEIEASPDGLPFLQHRELVQAERLWEGSMKRFSDLAEDLVACWKLIDRCLELLNNGPADGIQLIAQGDALEAKTAFEETESELLQLCGVCTAVSVYPDLSAGKAIVRRSQFLDSALYNDGLPPIFLRLSEAEQLKVGNAFVQRLAAIANPEDLQLGQRRIVALIDAGRKLGESLGIDLRDAVSERAMERPGDARLYIEFDSVEA